MSVEAIMSTGIFVHFFFQAIWKALLTFISRVNYLLVFPRVPVWITSLTALQFSTCHCIFKCSTSINRFSKIDYRSELGVKGLNVPVYTHGREWCLHPRQIFASSVQLLWKFDGTCLDELHWLFDLSRKHKMLRSFSRSFFTFQHREVWSTKFQLVRDVQKKLVAIHRLNRSPWMAAFW